MARPLHAVRRMPCEPVNGSLLLVEDDAYVARSLLRMLSGTRFYVLHVTRGDVALECVKRRFFDVVLSDLGLPGASGLEVLAAARARNPATALLLMSGAPTQASEAAAAALGVVAYLAKPLTRAELAFALQKASRASASASLPMAASDRA